jgi:hypothetical protein
MRLLNLNIQNLDALLNAALTCEIELPIDKQGNCLITDWADFKNKIIAIQRYYITQKSTQEISSIPPFESHPYIGDKIIPNLLHRTLVLGTFPPPSYLHELYTDFSDSNLLKDIDIDTKPPLFYFYGNRCSLWDIIGVNLNQKAISEYLDSSNIFISDIILFAQRKSLTKNRAADSNFLNIIPNIPLMKHLMDEENSIENIVFTSKQWNVTDAGGRGRRKSNYVPASIQFTEENSAISLFFRTLHKLNCSLSFQKLDTEQIVSFAPANYKKIKEEFTNLFAFNLLINNRTYRINIGDSPSGNAFTPFDSSSFVKWIRYNHGEDGMRVLKNHCRNSRNDEIKRERKLPIQRDLHYPEGRDICNDFQYDMYSMFFQRNYELIQQIQNQNI